MIYIFNNNFKIFNIFINDPRRKTLNRYVYTHILNNKHTLNLTMVPDDNYYNQIVLYNILRMKEKLKNVKKLKY